jgi:hypothetical protein
MYNAYHFLYISIMNYIPTNLSKTDQLKQQKMLAQSRKKYKQQIYVSRKRLRSFVSKPSRHIRTAKRMYHVESIAPNKELANATGCPISVLEQIVNKGEGAYYSSGSRPNQTAQSWAYARLASAVTGGKASVVDYALISKCDPSKKAYQLATKRKRS